MILFFVLAILTAAVVVLFSLFAPHKLPWYRPRLALNSHSAEMVRVQIPRQPIVMEGLASPEEETRLDPTLQEKVSRLETILLEKNTLIEKLQKQVVAEKSLREDFDKVKALLDEEIINLRKQNRELKAKQEKMNA
jgi:hypothetical protein